MIFQFLNQLNCMGFKPNFQTDSLLILMLYDVNVILYIFLYKKRLLVEVYKHLIYRFYLTGQCLPWNFAKFWKQSLGFIVMSTASFMSLT